jgi:hypothetical protein
VSSASIITHHLIFFQTIQLVKLNNASSDFFSKELENNDVLSTRVTIKKNKSETMLTHIKSLIHDLDFKD